MAEELSPESKLYVKEEIEKSRKEVKEEVEKVKSKATKTFTTVVIIVGLLTGLGVYGLAVKYIDKEIEDRISAGARDEITGYKEEAKSLRDEAKSLRDEIVGIKTNAEDKLSELEPVQQEQDRLIKEIQSQLKAHQEELLKSFKQVAAEKDYAKVGNIKFVWGTMKSTKPDIPEDFEFKDSFDNNCFFVITTLPGYVYNMWKSGFKYQRMGGIPYPEAEHQFWFLAIGN